MLYVCTSQVSAFNSHVCDSVYHLSVEPTAYYYMIACVLTYRPSCVHSGCTTSSLQIRTPGFILYRLFRHNSEHYWVLPEFTTSHCGRRATTTLDFSHSSSLPSSLYLPPLRTIQTLFKFSDSLKSHQVYFAAYIMQ